MMFRLEILCIFTCIYTLHGENMLGKGLWSLISVSECPDESLAKEAVKCDVNKHKLNRTHDGITTHIIISEEITESYVLYLDVCKFVDGGCKPYQIISDNIRQLCDKYAKDHVIKALKMAKFKNEYFPLLEGEYDLEDFLINYCDIPSVCLYGKYEVLAYLISDLQRVSCLKLVAECKKCDEVDECCENEVAVL